jgi:hypothetical protein
MQTREVTAPHCATCEVELTPRRHAVGFCCNGCEGGGPCTCSYDDVPEAAIPMSGTAYAALQQDSAPDFHAPFTSGRRFCSLPTPR